LKREGKRKRGTHYYNIEGKEERRKEGRPGGQKGEEGDTDRRKNKTYSRDFITPRSTCKGSGENIKSCWQGCILVKSICKKEEDFTGYSLFSTLRLRQD